MINYHIVFFNQDSVKTAYRTSMCIVLPFFTAYKTTVKDILQQAARTGKKIFISHRFFLGTVTLKEIETAYVSVYAAILLNEGRNHTCFLGS